MDCSNSAYISTAEAAKLSGFSQRHIQNLIKKGTLSASRTEAGGYIIDKAEFFRVFPQCHQIPERVNQGNIEVLEEKLNFLQRLLDDKDNQIIFLKDQLQSINNEKKIILETLNSSQKLLEDKSQKPRKKLFGIF